MDVLIKLAWCWPTWRCWRARQCASPIARRLWLCEYDLRVCVAMDQCDVRSSPGVAQIAGDQPDAGRARGCLCEQHCAQPPVRTVVGAAPLVRVTVIITVNNAVCVCPIPLHTAFLTVNLTLTLKSEFALIAAPPGRVTIKIRKALIHGDFDRGLAFDSSEWSCP